MDDATSRWPGGLSRANPSAVIVRFAPETSRDRRREIVQESGCAVSRWCDPGQVQLVRLPPEESPEQVIRRFETHQAVQYVEPDYLVRASFLPDDSFFPFQWNLGNAATGGIQMQAAWDIQQGDPNVIVAILDTGIAYEDFGEFVQAPDLAHTLFVPGYDFVNEDRHPNDDQGHGTHVCGTIAQSTNNGIGVAGVAFGCSIMPVKVLDANGVGGHFALAQGIYYAIEQGATVINMSLGGPDDSLTLREAVAEAHRRGITFVCAAGNEFLGGNPVAYPAAYDEYCIAVGAVRYDMSRAPYSNVGPYVDVVAPGGDVSVD
jgi:serine protease